MFSFMKIMLKDPTFSTAGRNRSEKNETRNVSKISLSNVGIIQHNSRWANNRMTQNTIAKKKPTKAARQKKGTRAKYPRQSVERALRIPKAILDQNAGKACTTEQAAAFLGVGSKGPFAVEVGSATKYGFLERPEKGKIQPTDLARKILRPKTPKTRSRAIVRPF